MSLANIKLLREKSGAGMMACQKALSESGGDIDKALEILRKQGIAKAAKREGNMAGEGTIKLAISADNKKGYILKINSETDFVAKNEKFQNFAQAVLDLALAQNADNLENLLALNMPDGHSVKENIESLSGIIGEKLVISEFAALQGETVAGYSHAGGTIGALAALDQADKQELAANIAMHVAAANPKYLTPGQVPQNEIEKEKEIYGAQLKKEGKPDNIVEKILEGKINKYFEEICLVKQEYIKDDKQKVEQILGNAKIKGFLRLSL